MSSRLKLAAVKTYSLVASAVLIALSMAAPLRAETTARVALITLPAKYGNPFASLGYPTITTTSAMFDGLTRLTNNGALEPGLATAWEKVDDLTWRFTLRPDVTFSNGHPLTARAVTHAVSYLISDDSLGDFLRNELPPMTGAREVDFHTVEIVTAGTEPIFPRHVVGLMLAEPEAWQDLGRESFARTPVGAGPFQLEAWEPGRAQLRAYKQSWRTAKVDRLELIELPDRVARVQVVLSGQVDIALDLGPEDLAAIEQIGGAGLAWSDGGIHGVSFATDREAPFKDHRVRQALNYAVQKEPIVDVILNGATVVASQPAARLAYGHNEAIDPYPYDPDRAKALLAEAGYGNGFSFTIDVTTAAPGAELTYQLIAEDLRAVGVTMDINVVPRGLFLSNVFVTGNYGDAFGMWWGTQPSLDSIRAVTLHSCRQRFAWFCDDSIMPKVNQALTTWDEADALRLRHEVHRYYHQQAPAIFLYETVLFAGLAPGVSGYEDNFGFVRYENISVADDAPER